MPTFPNSGRNLLVSIRPIHASRIVLGKKTVELRRKFPTEAVGASILIYSSSPVQAIIATARISDVLQMPISKIWRLYGPQTCISKQECFDYFVGLDRGFAILLEDARPLRRQIDLREMKREFGVVPPQSYRYLTGMNVA